MTSSRVVNHGIGPAPARRGLAAGTSGMRCTRGRPAADADEDHGQGPDGRAWQQRSLDSQRDDDRHHDSLSFAVREIRARPAEKRGY
jgi:hypothetical protein